VDQRKKIDSIGLMPRKLMTGRGGWGYWSIGVSGPMLSVLSVILVCCPL